MTADLLDFSGFCLSSSAKLGGHDGRSNPPKEVPGVKLNFGRDLVHRPRALPFQIFPTPIFVGLPRNMPGLRIFRCDWRCRCLT